MRNVPSSSFLFDEQRSGQLKYGIRSYELVPKFSFELRSYPLKGPESSPVFDEEGNLYFASHDGCFYSIDYKGDLRWMYNSGRTKNYGSPAIKDDYVVFTSGEGNVHCFSKKGHLLWTYWLGQYFDNISNRYLRKISKTMTDWSTYDWYTKKFRLNKCWSSPLIYGEQVFITGYGIGLHCIELQSGRSKWTFDLGKPRYPLSGIALDEGSNIYVAANRHRIYKLSLDGRLIWSFNLKEKYSFWGNPSVDVENQSVFFTGGIGEDQGIILCLGYDGRLKWKRKIQGAIRGTASISHEEYVVCGTLGGQLIALNKVDGSLVFNHLLTTAKRGLWTTPSIDPDGHILLTTKDSNTTGRMLILDKDGKEKASMNVGKALSVPVVDEEGTIYIGSWNGTMLAINT